MERKPSPEAVAEAPLRLRWEKDTRYYEVHLQQDLWGIWVLTRIWGRRNSPMGQMRRVPCDSYEDAARKLIAIRNQRMQRGYKAVGQKKADSVIEPAQRG